ncbi:hypothetical protein L7F22_019920 [Adiantum nelumboides]|nr:hypothetical protein [Adiantum nelumboides]
MTPIPEQNITLTICNRTSIQWQWIDSNDTLPSEKGFKSIAAEAKVTIACSLQSNAQLLATLRCNTASNESQQASVVIKLDTSNSFWGYRSCFPRKKASELIPNWLKYPVPTNQVSKRPSIILLYRQSSAKQIDFLILPDIPTSSFLSTLPDNNLLSQICIPGTHESLARYGWPISTCQSSQSTVQNQLQDGIRYLDVRLVPKGEPGQIRLLAYHGITDERIEFGAVLTQCWNFLQSEKGKRETIIMSIKQESGDQDEFIRTLFDTYVDQTPTAPSGKSSGRDRWFLENRVPKLGEVRGKIVMLSRFVIDKSYAFPGGISPPIWPNSFKGVFDYTLPTGQKVITQDWYDIGSLSQLDTKFSLIEQLSKESRAGDTFALNYTNGSSFPFALPPAVAKGFLDDGTRTSSSNNIIATQGINIRVLNFVADLHFDSGPKTASTLPGLQVTWAIDYYDEPKGAQDLIKLLIAANF